MSIDGPSGLRATYYHLDESNVIPVDCVSSCDKGTSHMRCLRLLLTVWAGHVSFNALPDDILLNIIVFDRVAFLDGLKGVYRSRLFWRWHRLVHVCRRWRSVVFASPIFLNLKLICGPETPVKLIYIWPPLPIIIRTFDWPMPDDYDFEAAILHRNRVCQINLFFQTASQLQRLASAMQEQFSALTHLKLCFTSFTPPHSLPAPDLPDGFLGGSAPRLQSLELNRISFPALPKLLLSATHLVRLTLKNIPHTGYISPEAVITCLTMLGNLRSLTIEFETLIFRADQESQRPPPLARAVLPALTRFSFQGASEYLEDLVAGIDTPSINSIWINIFHEFTTLVTLQLAHFMRRTAGLQAFNFHEARVDFNLFGVQLEPLLQTRTFNEKFVLRISCQQLSSQISSAAQVITSFIPSIYMVTHLYITGTGPLGSALREQTGTQNTPWLDFFRPFSAVENIYFSESFAPRIALALRELGGTTEVLPTLQNIFLEELQPSEPVQEAIGQFVANRQLLGRPVAVFDWNRT
jgi:hypothetical protein